MYTIQQITNAPRQQQTIVLPTGGSFFLDLAFVPMQYGWFIKEISYGASFTVHGIRIVNSPNLLHQYRNEIPFGLACFSTANREPALQQDFQSQASVLYLLSQAEVTEYARLLSGQVSA